jgi:metal-responsive CopG/Arc/MetJ family transcriptional regulator
MTKERKSKFTASVNEKIVAMVDERCAALNVSRSDVVQQAMEMWLHQQATLEEEEYFKDAAAEMNADAKTWNALTSKVLKHGQE